MSTNRILFVYTSASKLSNGHPTGWYLPEAAHPYYYVTSQGYEVDFASPRGPDVTLDQSSKTASEDSKDEESLKFLKDPEVTKKFEETLKLREVDVQRYDAIFYVGGHGPLVDLATDEDNIKIAGEFYAAKKPVSAVCHGPGALVGVKRPDGKSIWLDQTFTGFSNYEEVQVKLENAIPFSLEDRIKALSAGEPVGTQAGAVVNGKAETPNPEAVGEKENKGSYHTAKAWQAKVVTSKNGSNYLLTGQNPASARPLAERLVEVLKEAK